MEEFIKEHYTLITYSVECLAAVTGIVLYKKYKHTVAKYLIFFLVYAFLVDLLGNYPRHFYNLGLFYVIEDTLIEKNYWWFNIFWFFGTVGFVSYINYNIVEKKIFRKAIKYIFFSYSAMFLLYLVFKFENVFLILNSFITILSLWAVLSIISIYLLEILQSEKVIYFYQSIYFFINTAILLWFLILGPMVFYEIYFSTADWNFIILKWQIYLSVNIVFYLTLSLALIFCKPENK